MGGKQSRTGLGFQGNLANTLVGHNDVVLHCTFSPNGKLLATCSGDRTVMIWDLKSMKLKTQLKEHEDEVTATSFSNDSSLLISSSRDKRVILWDAKTWKHLQKARKHQASILHCAFSPEDKTVFATASSDKTVGLWKIDSEENAMARRELAGHKDVVFQVCFSPDNLFLASCSNDQSIIIWNRSSRKRVGKLRDPYSRVLTCQFSPDSTFIAAVVDGERVRIWNTLVGEVVNVLEGHHIEPIICCCFSPDGSFIVTGAGDKTYAVWDAKAVHAGPIYHARAHDSWVQSVAFSPDGKYLATTSSDKKVKLWI